MGNERAHLARYNALYRESDELYRLAAKTMGLSDCAMWILYVLRESGEPQTQSALCAVLCQPKQTVHSALKRLEAGGYLVLSGGSDRRTRCIRLTQRGITLAESTVDRVIQAETAALAGLSDGEQETLLMLLAKYTRGLRAGITALAPDTEKQESLDSERNRYENQAI